MSFIFSTGQTCIVLKSGWSSTARMPASSLITVLLPSPSQSPMPPPSQWPAPTTLISFAKLLLVWCLLCEALLSFPLTGQNCSSLLSRLTWRRYKGRFAPNTKTKSSIIFADTVDALTATFVRSLNTTMVERPIERHKSRLASPETGDGLTGTYSGGSLDRTESVLKWSRERRVRAGWRESPTRDKAVPSLNLNPSLCLECI